MSRYGWPFGVLFVDVDHFKQVNDIYGHGVGDEVLKMIALSLTAGLRPFDMLGRWGGEDFLAVGANVRADDLAGMAERCRVLVESSEMRAGGQTIRPTVSIGATLGLPGDTVESLVKRSDELMYQSKLAGRNRLTVQADAASPAAAP